MRKIHSILPALSALIITAVALLASPDASANPRFNATEIERGITEFYDIYSSEDPAGLTDADRLELADGLAEMLARLDATPFNDVVGHLLADYGTHPEHRAPIEILMSRTHHFIEPELRVRRERHVVSVVIDDVFRAWSVAYAFGFGKGLWASRGSGLQGIARFRHVVKNVSENIPRGMRANLLTAGIGAGAGIAHAIYLELQTQKQDPLQALLQAQTALIERLGTETAAARAELESAQRDPQLATHAEQIRARVQALDPQLRATQQQLASLYEAAPSLRSRMAPIAMDLQAARTILSRLGLRLDGEELRGAWLP